MGVLKCLVCSSTLDSRMNGRRLKNGARPFKTIRKLFNLDLNKRFYSDEFCGDFDLFCKPCLINIGAVEWTFSKMEELQSQLDILRAEMRKEILASQQISAIGDVEEEINCVQLRNSIADDILKQEGSSLPSNSIVAEHFDLSQNLKILSTASNAKPLKTYTAKAKANQNGKKILKPIAPKPPPSPPPFPVEDEIVKIKVEECFIDDVREDEMPMSPFASHPNLIFEEIHNEDLGQEQDEQEQHEQQQQQQYGQQEQEQDHEQQEQQDERQQQQQHEHVQQECQQQSEVKEENKDIIGVEEIEICRNIKMEKDEDEITFLEEKKCPPKPPLTKRYILVQPEGNSMISVFQTQQKQPIIQQLGPATDETNALIHATIQATLDKPMPPHEYSPTFKAHQPRTKKLKVTQQKFERDPLASPAKKPAGKYRKDSCSPPKLRHFKQTLDFNDGISNEDVNEENNEFEEEEEYFHCEICGSLFSSHENKRRHMMLEHVRCDDCALFFRNHKELLSHKRSEHKVPLIKSTTSLAPQQFSIAESEFSLEFEASAGMGVKSRDLAKRPRVKPAKHLKQYKKLGRPKGSLNRKTRGLIQELINASKNVDATNPLTDEDEMEELDDLSEKEALKAAKDLIAMQGLAVAQDLEVTLSSTSARSSATDPAASCEFEVEAHSSGVAQDLTSSQNLTTLRDFTITMTEPREFKAEIPMVKCHLCSKMFSSVKAVSMHIRGFHNKSLECKKCNKKFSSNKFLLNHRKKCNFKKNNYN